MGAQLAVILFPRTQRDPPDGRAIVTWSRALRVVNCETCNRTFELDAKLAAKARAARCWCGARIMLRRDSGVHEQGPRKLGNYVLIQRIAVGGMGEVFFAKMGGVKALLEKPVTDSEFRSRFKSILRRLRRLPPPSPEA